jgi:osmotically inducible protein OsmC
MEMSSLYETQATAIGGRAGRACSADGRLKVRLDLPKCLGGDDREGTNPEQLFAAGYAAAFLDSIRRAADRDGRVIAADSNVTATVAIRDENLSVMLAVDLPGVDEQAARRLAEAAHRLCPYSRAMRGNIEIAIAVG